MALLDQAVELNADAGRLNPQAQRRLVKAEKEPGILGDDCERKCRPRLVFPEPEAPSTSVVWRAYNRP